MMTDDVMRKSDRWIPWSIVAFFVVVAILDGIFVYLATSTHTGVVTKHAYEEGLHYNDTVAAAEEQAKLGWDGNIALSDTGSELQFGLVDANGQPISGARVHAEFFRPTQDGMDFAQSLVQNEAGLYATDVAFPVPGQWEVRIFVQWKQKQYQQTQRLMVAQ